MSEDHFGQLPDGRDVRVLVLGRAPGLELHLLDLGATVHRLVVTGGDGVRRDVTLGHPTPEHHLTGGAFLGGTIGRYANRIAGARFELDGREVAITANDDGNALHGGEQGFHTRTWQVRERTADTALLSLTSPDGDQGFPGELAVQALFEVTEDELRLTLSATTDAPTVVNLTQHLYLNLAGEGSGTIDQHELTVHASRYTPVDGAGIPTGEDRAVEGSALDLRRPRRLGDVVRTGDALVAAAQGVDHNLVLDGEGMREVARLGEPTTGTAVILTTDQPGLQVYTGNFLDGTLPSRAGGVHRQGDGIALEPQLPPNSPNRPVAGDAVLRPGQTYRWTTTWRFAPLLRTVAGP